MVTCVTGVRFFLTNELQTDISVAILQSASKLLFMTICMNMAAQQITAPLAALLLLGVLYALLRVV